jgi:hypothetical protein
MATAITKLTHTMDQLYEYDREPIPTEKFQPGRYYAGLLAGEHVAGTEFVIEPFRFARCQARFVLGLFLKSPGCPFLDLYLCPNCDGHSPYLVLVPPKDCRSRINPHLQHRQWGLVLYSCRSDDFCFCDGCGNQPGDSRSCS